MGKKKASVQSMLTQYLKELEHLWSKEEFHEEGDNFLRGVSWGDIRSWAEEHHNWNELAAQADFYRTNLHPYLSYNVTLPHVVSWGDQAVQGVILSHDGWLVRMLGDEIDIVNVDEDVVIHEERQDVVQSEPEASFQEASIVIDYGNHREIQGTLRPDWVTWLAERLSGDVLDQKVFRYSNGDVRVFLGDVTATNKKIWNKVRENDVVRFFPGNAGVPPVFFRGDALVNEVVHQLVTVVLGAPGTLSKSGENFKARTTGESVRVRDEKYCVTVNPPTEAGDEAKRSLVEHLWSEDQLGTCRGVMWGDAFVVDPDPETFGRKYRDR